MLWYCIMQSAPRCCLVVLVRLFLHYNIKQFSCTSKLSIQHASSHSTPSVHLSCCVWLFLVSMITMITVKEEEFWKIVTWYSFDDDDHHHHHHRHSPHSITVGFIQFAHHRYSPMSSHGYQCCEGIPFLGLTLGLTLGFQVQVSVTWTWVDTD